ncbi:MAG: methylmalonyl Co-A mutase-associated GTPase MeaB [Acidobacteria bacterium]|nr:methylmalonyl Co-A mutase-associated GTPase MeaB [Acidobacteriota bacterium]
MEDWTRRILAGEIRAVARAATAIENNAPEAAALLAAIERHRGRALVLGVTGAPGAGKSTLVDHLVRHYRAQGKTVGVLAVDPSSPFTGGAILGDRIRMQDHHADPGVFIRSMASRGWTGGVARATEGIAALLDASGRGVVIIETVGVGQGEVEVARLAGVVAVVLVPGMGDGVQAIKAGLMEIADVFVINKADHAGVGELEREIHQEAPGVPLVKTVASQGQGIAELAAAIESRSGQPRRRMERAGGFEIDHLGIAVRSIDSALRFYAGQLGLALAHRETVEQERVHVAMLPVGGSRVELIEPADSESSVARSIAKRGEGLHHVALRTARFAEAVERLRAGGARILNEPRTGAGGHTYVFVHPESTGGVLLELIEEKE